jgi:hypothetical protein
MSVRVRDFIATFCIEFAIEEVFECRSRGYCVNSHHPSAVDIDYASSAGTEHG